MPTTGRTFKKAKISDDANDVPNYFDSAEFKSLCEKVVEMVRKAERKRIPATYRHFNEKIGKKQRLWLFEAVQRCKREGLISENSTSVLITSFVIGGRELKPDTTPFNKSLPMGSKKSVVPNWEL